MSKSEVGCQFLTPNRPPTHRTPRGSRIIIVRFTTCQVQETRSTTRMSTPWKDNSVDHRLRRQKMYLVLYLIFNTYISQNVWINQIKLSLGSIHTYTKTYWTFMCFWHCSRWWILIPTSVWKDILEWRYIS